MDFLAESTESLSISSLVPRLPGELRNQIYSYLVPDMITVDSLGDRNGAYRYDRLATNSSFGSFEAYDFEESERCRRGCIELLQSSSPAVSQELRSLLRPVTVLELSVDGLVFTKRSTDFLETASDAEFSQFSKFVIRTEYTESADICDDGDRFLCWSIEVAAESAVEIQFTGDKAIYRLHIGNGDEMVSPFNDFGSWDDVITQLGLHAAMFDKSKGPWLERQGMFEAVHGALMKRKSMEMCGFPGPSNDLEI